MTISMERRLNCLIPDMKIAAITRYKHGPLFLLLKKLGWSQSELARRTKLHPAQIGDVINMVTRPTQKTADKIQAAFGEAGEYLDVLEAWPEGFYISGRGFRHEQVADIDPEQLCLDEVPEVKLLTAPDVTPGALGLSNLLFADQIRSMLNHLPPHYRVALRLRYMNEMALDEISRLLQISAKELRGVLLAAKNKLQASPRMQKVAHLAFMSDEEIDIDDDDLFAVEQLSGPSDAYMTCRRLKGENNQEFNRRAALALQVEAELDKLEGVKK